MSIPTVTVVTGPPGVDIGPAVAHLGRDLGDGLAIRTVVSPAGTSTRLPRNGAHGHASPNPYAATPFHESVPLYNLPSAWQDPQTNLGVAYTGAVTNDLAFDIETLHNLGLDPSHRVTVSRRNDADATGGDHRVPQPVEIGDLAVIARDSVLRGAADSSRHVLIEAGDGQTFLDALHTVGLPPWSPHVRQFDLWLVVDAAGLGIVEPGNNPPGGPVVAILADQVVATAREAVTANGGAPARPVTLSLAVLNGHLLLPDLAGVDTETFLNTDRVSADKANAFDRLALDISERSGAVVELFGTGQHTFIFID